MTRLLVDGPHLLLNDLSLLYTVVYVLGLIIVGRPAQGKLGGYVVSAKVVGLSMFLFLFLKILSIRVFNVRFY